MLTEDSHRRRELADLGITAEVEGDGHKIVATFDRPQFDALVERATSARTFAFDDGYEEGYSEGHIAGVRQGAKAVEAKPAADKAAVGS
jgi:hypothetical protein